MLTKELVNSQIKDMPNEFTLDELIERLILVEKVNQGLKEVEIGKTISEEELDKKMAEWFA
jgi:parvulin-like peptidyl-prolyl isomerase